MDKCRQPTNGLDGISPLDRCSLKQTLRNYKQKIVWSKEVLLDIHIVLLCRIAGSSCLSSSFSSLTIDMDFLIICSFLEKKILQEIICISALVYAKCLMLSLIRNICKSFSDYLHLFYLSDILVF